MNNVTMDAFQIDSFQDILEIMYNDIISIFSIAAEYIPNFSRIIDILKILFVLFIAYLVVNYTIVCIRRIKRKKQLNALATDALEMTPEEFKTLRSSAFVGKERKHYQLAQDFPGVYILFNKTKKMHYVGQSTKVISRVNDHFRGKGNGDVYADYIYGDEFTIKIISLESSGYSSLNKLERHMISHYKAFSRGYNKTRGNRG